MEIGKIDKSNMRKDILNFPRQFRVGLKAAENVKIENLKLKIENLIVCGVGGSALPGSILKMFLEENKIPLSVKIHRDYGLPYSTDKNSHLIICISYSGNTEETLSAFEEARKKQLKIAAIASGGKLAELCQKYNIPFAKIPGGLQPRMALGYQFSALIKILENCGLIKKGEEDIPSLENVLKPKNLENQGKKIAKKLKNKIPLIYASRKFKNLAYIWKIKFNENSKIPAFSNYFPELNHNEHSQFDGKKNSQLTVLLLRDKNDHPRIIKRMDLFSKILKPKKVPLQFIDIDGENIIYKVFNNILLSDWVSYYLALEYKIDPTPVRLNDEFKKRLTQ